MDDRTTGMTVPGFSENPAFQRLDTQAKLIMRMKWLFARILLYFVPGFENWTLEEIYTFLSGTGDPSAAGRVMTNDSSMKSVEYGNVFMVLLSVIKNPVPLSSDDLGLNEEIQGIQASDRSFFGRSAVQISRLFVHLNAEQVKNQAFGNLNDVLSVWFVISSKKDFRNTVMEIGDEIHTLYGDPVQVNPLDYVREKCLYVFLCPDQWQDLISVDVENLGEEFIYSIGTAKDFCFWI